ncbi:PA14 domain-containing protein [Enhygromyxa salina]|nr:PA14 domain-containing protein [Enhygromyxa salina]
MVSVLALAGCAKKQVDETQNPDGVTDADGSGDSDSASSGTSRARGSTATRSGGRNTKARKVTSKKPPRPIVVPDENGGEEGPNGLLAEGFAVAAVSAVPDFSTLGEPSSSFVVANLDFDEDDAANGFPGDPSLTSNYALRFSGSINITEEAEYELCLHSDDGSQLLLEDTLLVDNDGVHDGAVETCELLYLAPGEYRLEIRYIQADGPLMTMHFAWSMDGGDKVIVPTEVLFKPDGTAG